MLQVSYSRIVLLLFVVLAVFFTELGTARLWDRDEPRNSRASHEMLARGDWIVPTFNGELRDHKPILLYWGQMLSYRALGESEFSARLPSVLCALLTVAAVAVLASRLSGRPKGLSQEGFWAASCLATCLLFVMAGRAATPDSCLIAFSTLGIAALVIGSLSPAAPYSSGRVAKTRWLPALFGYAMLGLAALAKGPVGIVLPLAVVHSWWMVCRRLQSQENSAVSGARTWLEALRTTLLEAWLAFHPLQCFRAIWGLRAIPGVLLSLLVATPWYAAVGMQTNGEFLRGFFLEHNVGRAMGSMEGHQGSILFYPLAFVVGVFPWSLWLIPIALWCRTAIANSVVQRQMVVLAVAWMAVYIVAFSAASTKLPSYITPCYAGAALLLGGYWRQFENAWSRPQLQLRHIAYALTIVVGIGVSGGILWLSRHESMPLLARAATCGAVLAAVGMLGFACERFSRTNWVPVTWLMGAAVFQTVLFGYGTKSVDLYRQDLAALTGVSHATAGEHWLAIGGMEPSWVHYLNSEIVEVTDDPAESQAWEQVSAFLKQFPTGKIVVVGESTHLQFLDWQKNTNSPDFAQLSEAPRFLRPGNLRVYQQANASETGVVAHTAPQPTTLQPATLQPATLQPAKIFQSPPAVESHRESGPGIQPLSVLRSAETVETDNPLRPRVSVQR